MLPLGNLISQFNYISHHCYADDMQLYFSFKCNDIANISILHDCLTAIKDWMSLNFLQLNSDKTKVLFFGPNKLIPELNPSISPLAPISIVLHSIQLNCNFPVHISVHVSSFYFILSILFSLLLFVFNDILIMFYVYCTLYSTLPT